GNFSVLMSVPEHSQLPPLSTNETLATDFVRSAIAPSSAESLDEQETGIVHEAAAAFGAIGDSVKCTTEATLTAPASGRTALKSSITCAAPSVHGVQASLPSDPSIVISSMRASSPCTRASIGA